MALDLEFVKAVKRAVNATWQAIGPDAEGMCECNEEALEMCLDADRMQMYGGDETAYKVYKLEVAQSGWTPTVQFLNKHIQLM